jgi:glycosyltransferase involved in cell wall biosynthesis
VRRAFPELRDVTSVPFGYDAAAFAGEPPARADDRFRIVHVGEFHTEIGRRQERHRGLRRVLGGDSPANVLARSPLYLLRALERVGSDRVELHLAGRLSAADEEILAGSPLVHRHGYLPHADAVALMRSADLLFLPMYDVSGRAGLVPGKTYEYLASGRPILAAVPDGDARDLLRDAGAHVVAPTDDAAMADVIRQELDEPTEPGPARLDRYEYAAVTRSLAEILDGVIGRRVLR